MQFSDVYVYFFKLSAPKLKNELHDFFSMGISQRISIQYHFFPKIIIKLVLKDPISPYQNTIPLFFLCGLFSGVGKQLYDLYNPGGSVGLRENKYYIGVFYFALRRRTLQDKNHHRPEKKLDKYTQSDVIYYLFLSNDSVFFYLIFRISWWCSLNIAVIIKFLFVREVKQL